MPAIRTPDCAYGHADDDGEDGMPPLVDNPASAMTFTFTTDMIPITYSNDPTGYEILPEQTPSAHASFDAKRPTQASRGSHTKKRDASYIPRPPNAFILFRSSFIRSKQVPGKVEGNHSTLSKIVGMYWKTLPREEREFWEAKALVAQAEHRKRYPDWRFRPGANALLKLKIKDGGGGNHRKRTNQYRRTKGGDAEEKGRIKEQRCAKIADLLLEGKKGSDLAAAVQAWERDGRNREEYIAINRHRKQESQAGDTDTTRFGHMADAANVECAYSEPKEHAISPRNQADLGPIRGTVCVAFHRCQTPNSAVNTRFKIPLTSMFRRSLSAPAPISRYSCSDAKALYEADVHHGSEATTPAVTLEDVQTDACESPGFVPSFASPTSVGSASPPWSDSFTFPHTSDSENAAAAYELSGLTVSPLETSFDLVDFNSVAKPSQHVYSGCDYLSYQSSYSTLQDWAGLNLVAPSSQSLLSDAAYLNPHVSASISGSAAVRMMKDRDLRHLHHDFHGFGAEDNFCLLPEMD